MNIRDGIAHDLVLGFMCAGLFKGITVGWTTLIQFAPWLPPGTRIVSGYPYSLLLFGFFTLVMIRKFGWAGLFATGFLNMLWELSFVFQPTILGIVDWPVFVIGSLTSRSIYIGNGIFAYAAWLGLALAGLKVKWKRLMVLCLIMWAVAIPGGQLETAGNSFILPNQMNFTHLLPQWVGYAAEFITEAIATGAFLILMPIRKKERKQSTRS